MLPVEEVMFVRNLGGQVPVYKLMVKVVYKPLRSQLSMFVKLVQKEGG